MNRKQKIILSVTGIFIVLLILVGLTYAYFLTTIFGNTNSKSISVTTANLILEYADIDDILVTANNIQPGTSIVKKFSATNKGNADINYGVTLENVVNDFIRTNDVVYTLTCTSSDNSSCNGVDDMVFPSTNEVMVTNDIKEGVTDTYTLTITYKEMNVDQSVDMKKEFSAKINLIDGSLLSTWNNAKEGTLLYAIKRDNVVKTPQTTPGVQVSNFSEALIASTLDDYGTSYYYRGNVKNNYLNFAGMCWRIVRVAGNGNIKLILDDKNTTCNDSSYTGDWSAGQTIYGYDSNYNSNYDDYDGGLKTTLTNWYNSKLTSYQNKLKSESICLGDITTKYDIGGFGFGGYYHEGIEYFSYDTYKRLTSSTPTPSLKCNGQKTESSFVYTITEDEVIFAGGKVSSRDSISYYLTPEFMLGKGYWTITPASKLFDDESLQTSVVTCFSVDLVGYNGTSLRVNKSYENNYFYARPMITLLSSNSINKGNGTKSNPYIVD